MFAVSFERSLLLFKTSCVISDSLVCAYARPFRPGGKGGASVSVPGMLVPRRFIPECKRCKQPRRPTRNDAEDWCVECLQFRASVRRRLWRGWRRSCRLQAVWEVVYRRAPRWVYPGPPIGIPVPSEHGESEEDGESEEPVTPSDIEANEK